MADRCPQGTARVKPRASTRVRETKRLATLFKVLGSPTRLRLLELLLREGEVRVGEIATALRMTPQAVSNQLRRLEGLSVVSARRCGVEVRYRVCDPCVPALLETASCLLAEGCVPRKRR